MKHNPQVTRLSALANAGINVKSGSPVDVVHQHTRTLGNNIDKLSQPRQWAIAHLMNEAADLLVVETGTLQDDYIDYFKGALEKFGVSSPAELSQDKASEFFNWISANWKKGVGPKAEASVETAATNYWGLKNPKHKADDYINLGKKYGFTFDGFDESGIATWKTTGAERTSVFKAALDKLEGKKVELIKEEAGVEVAATHYWGLKNPKHKADEYISLGKKYGFVFDGFDESGIATWKTTGAERPGPFQAALNKLEGKKVDLVKEEASVETASQFSFVKVSQEGRTYRLEASDKGNFRSIMIWKGGMWAKPGPGEEFKEKEPHRMLGELRTPNGAELATLMLPETPVASMEEMAELFSQMGIEESEIRRFYGGGPEWNDRSVYDGDIPSVSPVNLSANPTYAYTDMHPLRAYEAEDTIRINGLDATLQAIDNGQAVFTADGVDTTTVPLDNIVVAEGEASVVATAMVSHRVLVTAGHEDLTQYKSLRHDFESATANHQELAGVKVGPALQALAKAGNRRALVLAHAGVQRINEGHALLKASIGYGKEAATASVITELADLNNLCGKDQVSPQDVIDSAPVVTHLKQGEFKEDMPDTVDPSDFELNDTQAEQASTRKSRFPSRKR
ncbi:hypothetical protein Peetri_00005 [Pseudomonas phage vB_PpuM-Peetri]